MSVLRKTTTAGLAVALVGTALMATAPTADARPHYWGGVAAGAVGGLVAGALISQAARPAYGYPAYSDYYAPRPVYYREYYRPVYVPACHFEWRHNSWGDAYRVQVCPR